MDNENVFNNSLQLMSKILYKTEICLQMQFP